MKTEVFRHNEEKWSHTFRIPRGRGILRFGILGVSLEFGPGTTVMDVKKSMVRFPVKFFFADGGMFVVIVEFSESPTRTT